MSRLLPILLAALLIAGCKKKPESSAPSVASSNSHKNQIATPAPPVKRPTPLPDIASVPLDGTIALHRARTICGLGSRAHDTPGYRQTLAYLRSELTRLGWKIALQTFETKTAPSPRTYTNLIAVWPTDETPSDNQLILTAHYDAPGSTLNSFPAASEGAAGCGLLLEFAERLKEKPDIASRIRLVFLDGEEPVQQISTADGLAGSRFFIHSLVENGELTKIRALIAYGAIGHTGAKWTLPTLTNPVINQALQDFAIQQKWTNQATLLGRPDWGPHLPALQAGLAATYLHDSEYPAVGTLDDSPTTLNAESLRRAGRATLQLLLLPPATKPN